MIDLDSQRELRRAALKISALEVEVAVYRSALTTIRHAACDASTPSCACCMHDRMVAETALRDGPKVGA